MPGGVHAGIGMAPVTEKESGCPANVGAKLADKMKADEAAAQSRKDDSAPQQDMGEYYARHG